MSEQKISYMAELDSWMQANVIGPLSVSDPNQNDWEAAVQVVREAIRQKVLQSYRNGQAAGPRPYRPRQ